MSTETSTNHNVVRPVAQCWEACRQAPWRLTIDSQGKPQRMSPGGYVLGDVRRCPHGNIWYCEGRHARGGYRVSGYWFRLSRFWNPVLYRRAERLLGKWHK